MSNFAQNSTRRRSERRVFSTVMNRNRYSSSEPEDDAALAGFAPSAFEMVNALAPPNSEPATPILQLQELERNVKSVTRTLTVGQREFFLRAMSAPDCEPQLPATQVTSISNLLGRYPEDDYAQIAHLDDDMCMSLIDTGQVVVEADVAYMWDHVTTRYGFRVKAAIQVATWHERENITACTTLLDCAQSERVVILVPAMTESHEMLEVGIGTFRMTAPWHTRYSHVGISVPWRFRHALVLYTRGIEYPFFYFKAAKPGRSQLAFTRSLPAMAFSGIDHTAAVFVPDAMSTCYRFKSVRGGKLVLRFRRLTYLMMGTVALRFKQPTSIVITLPVVSASGIVLHATFRGTAFALDDPPAVKRQFLCAHSFGAEGTVIRPEVIEPLEDTRPPY